MGLKRILTGSVWMANNATYSLLLIVDWMNKALVYDLCYQLTNTMM